MSDGQGKITSWRKLSAALDRALLREQKEDAFAAEVFHDSAEQHDEMRNAYSAIGHEVRRLAGSDALSWEVNTSDGNQYVAWCFDADDDSQIFVRKDGTLGLDDQGTERTLVDSSGEPTRISKSLLNRYLELCERSEPSTNVEAALDAGMRRNRKKQRQLYSELVKPTPVTETSPVFDTTDVTEKK
jgi:hypothetical protein